MGFGGVKGGEKMIKQKVILFGASKYGEKVFEKIKNKYEVIYFCDNDNKK